MRKGVHMRKLNIGLFNDSFPPTIDGVAQTVKNYATVLQQNHCNVTVVTPEYKGVEDRYPFEVFRYQSVPLDRADRLSGGQSLQSRYAAQAAGQTVRSHARPRSLRLLRAGEQHPTTVRRCRWFSPTTPSLISISPNVSPSTVSEKSPCGFCWKISNAAG